MARRLGGEKDSQAIIVFHSTHQALKAEEALKKSQVEIEIVPLPKGLSANCGLAILFDLKKFPNLKEILKRYRIKYKGIYPYEE